MDGINQNAKGYAVAGVNNTGAQDKGKPLTDISAPSEFGVWLFILADMCIFAMYFAVHLWEKSLNPDMFLQGQATLNTQYGGFNTVVLLLGSCFVAKSLHAARHAQIDRYKRLLTLTILTGVVFLVVKTVEYQEKFAAGFHIATNEFYRNYFAFTGFHMLHVIIGLSFLMWLLFSINSKEKVANNLGNIESVGLYWHMVDLLWVILFALIYLAK
ncbi:MAG: cytochrome c oxidase subunit 3 [Pseudomonadales bacterium]|nr:cytochrome c oxidase subunit 3 [Pseudomonadales bacterium]